MKTNTPVKRPYKIFFTKGGNNNNNKNKERKIQYSILITFGIFDGRIIKVRVQLAGKKTILPGTRLGCIFCMYF